MALACLQAAVQVWHYLRDRDADFESERRAINDAGVFRCLGKPWNDAELAVHVGAALAHGAGQAAARHAVAARWS